MRFLQAQDPGVLDNEVLDEFEVPFGAWMDQAVDWIDVLWPDGARERFSGSAADRALRLVKGQGRTKERR